MEDEEEPPPDIMRTAIAIARRALVLSQVVSVAYGDSREQVIGWLRREGLLSDLSPLEQDFLATAPPSEKDRIAFSWGIERLVPLMWAIQKLPEMPPLTSQCDTDAMKESIVWPPAPSLPFIESASLRSEEEIRVEYEKIYNAHWRVRDAQLNHRPIPDGLDGGSIYERHYGFNWLIGYCGQDWDEISTDT